MKICHRCFTDQAKGKKEKGNVCSEYCTVFPDKAPNKRYTIIIVQAPKEVNVDDPLEFKFTLSDNFYNLFIYSKKDNLVLMNHI